MQPIPLAQARPGGGYYVESVAGPEQQRHRLCELGIVPGAPLAVLSCGREGAFVVKIGGGSRMALSQGIVEHINVQPTAAG